MWTKYKIEPNCIYKWVIGSSEFYLKNFNNIFYVQSNLSKKFKGFSHNIVDETAIDINSHWRNFIADKSKSICLLPVMPNRPLLLKPASEIFVLPERSCTIYVLIPVWVQFYAGYNSNSSNLLFEEPSADLSGTWFGDPDNGLLSYDFYSEIIFKYHDIKAEGNQVICPINISNDSNSQLNIERLLIQTEHLKIYSSGDTLSSNELKVRYKGESDSGLISFGKQAPSFVKDSKLLTIERIAPTEGLLRKSFYFLKSNVGY